MGQLSEVLRRSPNDFELLQKWSLGEKNEVGRKSRSPTTIEISGISEKTVSTAVGLEHCGQVAYALRTEC